MSDAEDELQFESLIATRARRSNAGSRLKQLLELEEQSNEITTTRNQFVTEDDENVDLLFQEDGDDEEFIDEDVDNANLEGIDEDSDEDDEDGEKLQKKRKRDENEESDDEVEEEGAYVNPDEVLSDSDLSESDTDESEGEKELIRQEKLKKKKQKKQNLIPTIKQAQPKSPVKKKQRRIHLITSDSLLTSNRRSSSRAAAVESKQALVDKLKESEARRAKYVHVERKKHVELTQEERLAEAVETEKANVESLNRFREQEIVKKERQRQLLLLKRVKLQNVIRIVSKEYFTKPIEEVTDARRRYEEYLKLRKKLGKKKKNQLDIENFPTKMPFSIDYESPYQKALLAEKKKKQEEEEIKRLESMNEKLQEMLDDADKIKVVNEKDPDSIDIEKKESAEVIVLDEEATDEQKDQAEEIKEEVKESTTSVDESEKQDVATNLESVDSELKVEKNISTDDISTETVSMNESKNESKNEETSPVELKQEENEQVSETNNDDAPENEKDNINANNTPDTIIEDPIKRVKFADEVESQSSKENTPAVELKTEPKEKTEDEDAEIFEGPVQRVCRNMIYLVDFDEDRKDLRLNSQNIKKFLFGKQSLLPASRRFKDVKTILTIGKVENPYAVVKQEKDRLFERASDLKEDDPMFDELKKLPKLGIKQDIVEVEENKEESESTAIVLKTEAPTGLYLPNGNKKNCMISGTEVKYFDPSTGIPYSSVEAYKILKSIEQGQVPWLSFTGEHNDTGNVELYLGSRDGSTRHAQGVPEGFDG